MLSFFGGEPIDRPLGPNVAILAVAALGVVDARLLWSLRHLALMAPIGTARCQTVHIALQRDFGDSGLGIEHLLRCWLVGLARLADRRLAIGTPACPLLTRDESALLAILRHGDEAALVALAGPRAANLLPLFIAMRTLIADC